MKTYIILQEYHEEQHFNSS